MNAMIEDEHYQLNEVSQVHLMISLGKEQQVLSMMKIVFDEMFHSNVEER
jgi:hypothetical protein